METLIVIAAVGASLVWLIFRFRREDDSGEDRCSGKCGGQCGKGMGSEPCADEHRQHI